MTAASAGWSDGFHVQGCEANRDEDPCDLQPHLWEFSFDSAELGTMSVLLDCQAGCESTKLDKEERYEAGDGVRRPECAKQPGSPDPWQDETKLLVQYQAQIKNEAVLVADKGLAQHPTTDEVTCLMQRRKDNKRPRPPTPRRRRIPARGRVHFEPSERQMRRSSWMHNPERPTSSASWASFPWRRSHNATTSSRPSRPTRAEPEQEETCEAEPEEHPNASASHLPSAPPLPPFEEGIRTWGELIGILDPMDVKQSRLSTHALSPMAWTGSEE